MTPSQRGFVLAAGFFLMATGFIMSAFNGDLFAIIMTAATFLLGLFITFRALRTERRKEAHRGR